MKNSTPSQNDLALLVMVERERRRRADGPPSYSLAELVEMDLEEVLKAYQELDAWSREYLNPEAWEKAQAAAEKLDEAERERLIQEYYDLAGEAGPRVPCRA